MVAKIHNLETKKSISKASRLLHSLVPRAQVFCFYDRARDCVWSSDGADDYEIDAFVAELPEEIIERLGSDEDIFRRTLPSGRTILAMPVFDDGAMNIGILIALFSKNAGKSASFNPSMLKNILEPAIELLGQSLHVGRNLLDSKRRADEIEQELELVYEIDEKIHSSTRRHSSLAQLVGQSGRYLGINYSVLLIPSKRIRISATHSSWKKVNRKVMDRYIIQKLLPKLEGQRKPIIFEIPTVEGAGEDAEQSFQAMLCPILDQQGNVEGTLAQLGRVDKNPFSKSNKRFMSHIVRKVEYVIQQSFDGMTGLMNRAGFEAQLHESFKALSSSSDAHQIIYFDLDNLQLVNDSISRKAGDEVILRFARLLEEDLPQSGVLSRLTGDDFCLLLTHADSSAAMDFADKVRKKSPSLRYLEGDKSLQVTMSIGIAEFSLASGDDGNVLTTARMACEAAKAHGRDRIEMFDDKNQSAVRRFDDMQLVAQIQQALDGELFELCAQRIASLNDSSSNPHFEILLRMQDGDGRRVPTEAFFSAAERYRMMPQIDRWVVSTTIARLSETHEVVEGQGANFSINLSGQSLGDDDILEFIEDEIEQSMLGYSSFCFEITESAAVSNLKKAQAFIDRLRERGCKISLDDFGAGLSSFAYLKNFNVDTLKIDGSFIRDITDNRISESMVAAITQVAKVMELKTVAEYVETEETRKLLGKLGVDFVQGHIVGKPTPLEIVLSEMAAVKSSTG